MDSIFKKKPLDPRLATFSSQPNINTALPLYSMVVKNSNAPVTTPAPVAPPVTPAPQIKTPAPLSAMDKVTQTLNDQTDSIKKYYEAKLLRDEQRKNQQIQEAQSALRGTEESQKAGIQDLEGQTNNLIAEEEQSMGQEQRQQARTAQDTRKRLQNQFAALGTLEGSQYGQAAYAAEQDLANKQANTRATSGRTISGYKLSLNDAKRNFVSLVSKEKAALQARINEIESIFEKGSEEYNKAIRDAVFGAQNKINEANLQIETAKEVAKVKEGSNSGFGASTDLRKEFNTRVKADDFMKVSSNYQNIINATPTAAGDMNMIFSYMKLLDPSSTVREGEFATAQQTAGLPAQVVNQYNKVVSGTRLGQEQRNQFKNEAKNIYQNSANTFNQQKKYFDELAMSQGIDPQYVTGGFNTSSSQIVTAPDGTQIEIID